MEPFMRFVFLSLLFFLFSCNEEVHTKTAVVSNTVNHEAIKKERESPVDFLKSEGSFRKNVAGRWVVEGTITNTATETMYKDVVVKVFYYKKKKEVGAEELTVNDYFQPLGTKEFKVKSYGVTRADSVGHKIIGAKVAN